MLTEVYQLVHCPAAQLTRALPTLANAFGSSVTIKEREPQLSEGKYNCRETGKCDGEEAGVCVGSVYTGVECLCAHVSVCRETTCVTRSAEL